MKDQIFIPIQSWIIIDKIDLKAIAPEYAELHKHWVRTHLRKALNEERMNAAINLLLLPIVQRKEKSENKLREDKKQRQIRYFENLTLDDVDAHKLLKEIGHRIDVNEDY